jgi:DNA-binding protein H-NS
MSKAKTLDIFKEFEKLQKQVLVAKKEIEKQIAAEVETIQKKYAKELHRLDAILSGSNVTPNATKTDKATSNGKRIRRSLPKKSDQEIKDSISKIAADGKKVTSAQIFKAAEITRPRFNAFIKDNAGFLKIEGKKRSTVYFL